MSGEMADFSYDGATTLGKLREKIGDVLFGRPLFSDTELNSILDEWDDKVNLAAAEALTRLKIRPDKLQVMFGANSLDNYNGWVSTLDAIIRDLKSDGEAPGSDDEADWTWDADDQLEFIKNRRF